MKLVWKKSHRRQNKCSVHDNEQVMADQKEKLGRDMWFTLEKDVEQAYRDVLGKLPSDRQRKRHYRVVTLEDYKPNVYVVLYKKRRICAYTAPITFQKGYHFFMRWYFQAFTS